MNESGLGDQRGYGRTTADVITEITERYCDGTKLCQGCCGRRIPVDEPFCRPCRRMHEALEKKRLQAPAGPRVMRRTHVTDMGVAEYCRGFEYDEPENWFEPRATWEDVGAAAPVPGWLCPGVCVVELAPAP